MLTPFSMQQSFSLTDDDSRTRQCLTWRVLNPIRVVLTYAYACRIKLNVWSRYRKRLVRGAGVTAQWPSAYVACTRSWIPYPAPQVGIKKEIRKRK